MSDFAQKYKSGAPNQLAKEALTKQLFQERAGAICDLFKGDFEVNDWKGKVYDVTSDAGKGGLSIFLDKPDSGGTNVELSTWNNVVSDKGDNGCVVTAEGDRLIVDGALTDAKRASIVARKPELIAILAAETVSVVELADG